MTDFVDAVEIDIVEHVLGIATWTAPVAIYVALSTSTPLDDGTNFTEPTPTEYARVQIVPSAWTLVSSVADNDANIDFIEATESWGTITHAGLYDASGAGNLIMWSALSVSKIIGIGDTFRFKAGELTVEVR